jgi:hypothetical protein
VNAEPTHAEAGSVGAVSKKLTEREYHFRSRRLADESDMMIAVDSRDSRRGCGRRCNQAALMHARK